MFMHETERVHYLVNHCSFYRSATAQSGVNEIGWARPDKPGIDQYLQINVSLIIPHLQKLEKSNIKTVFYC